MSKKKACLLKSTVLIILMFILSLVLIGCGGSSEKSASSAPEESSAQKTNPTTQPKGDILIGFSGSMTGAVPLEGLRSQQGADLAIEEINKNGGVLGKNLKLVVEDDQALANVAVNAVNKLMSEDIVALVGPHKSSLAKAVLQIVEKNKVPFLTGGTSVSLLASKNPYFFRIRASDGIVAKVAAKFATKELKAKNIGIFYNNDEYGTGARDVIEDYLKSVNVKFVSEGHNTGDKDLTGQIIKLRKEKIDAVIIWTHGPESAVAARQFKELNLKVPIISGPAFTIKSNFLDMVDASMVEGAYSITDFCPQDSDPRVQAFVKKFHDKYKADTDYFVTTYYDAIYVLADAMKRAKSTDKEAIRKALLETKKLQGIMSRLNANTHGELVHEAVVIQYKNKVAVVKSKVREYI